VKSPSRQLDGSASYRCTVLFPKLQQSLASAINIAMRPMLAVDYDSDSGARPPVWSKLYTIESEVVFVDGRMRRRNQRRDGQAADMPYPIANGGFGMEIRPLLDPSCPTTIEFESSAGGKTWFRFRSPANACFGALGTGQGSGHRVARTGRFLADDLTGDLIPIRRGRTSIPKKTTPCNRETKSSPLNT
jgi:hypothetical protein